MQQSATTASSQSRSRSCRRGEDQALADLARIPKSDCRKREADEKSELLRTTEVEMLSGHQNQFVEKGREADEKSELPRTTEDRPSELLVVRPRIWDSNPRQK
jgi:hypothetical protein